MKKILFSLVLLISFMHINAQITVDKSNKYLITKDDGKPFFWMADTGRSDTDSDNDYPRHQDRVGERIRSRPCVH